MNAQQKSLDFLGIQAKILGLQRYLVMRLRESRFNDPEINTKNAQLIFSTHDVTLMNPSYMRRDQLFFVDKNEIGISELYALDEFSEVRKNTPFAKWYMQHRFNATPRLDYPSIRDFMKEDADAQE